MPLTFAFFTMLNAFWIMLFIAAPFCVEYETGQTGAAPKKIHWKKLTIIASILACLVTLAIAVVIKTGIISVK